MGDTAKKKVLLVDDSALIRQIYKDKLEEEGYLVETAADGEEGVFKMLAFAPDIVLLDIFMPKMSGLDLIEKIKNEPSLNHIPIIVFSDVHVDHEDLVKKGVKHVMVKSEHKPVDVKEVIENIIS